MPAPHRDAADLARGELVGLRVLVVASGDPGLRGRQGLVVDETMKTFTLAADCAAGQGLRRAGEVVVPKAGQTFAFTLPDGSTHTLEGRDLARRPEDRTRKARPRQARRASLR